MVFRRVKVKRPQLEQFVSCVAEKMTRIVVYFKEPARQAVLSELVDEDRIGYAIEHEAVMTFGLAARYTIDVTSWRWSSVLAEA
jgi:hypothetical protein